MDSKAVETLAINAVRGRVVISDFLDQFIADNDKEPSFDGFIYMYSAGGKRKENYVGRIAVQIKGTQKKTLAMGAAEIKYPVKVTDLRSYLEEGGVVYFIVTLLEDGMVRQIYYNDLLPAKIMKILEHSAGTQANVSIKFKSLPSNPERLHTLLRSFYGHKKKQSVLHDLKEIPSIDELQEKGILREISFSVLGSGAYKNHIDAFLREDVYIYAKVFGFDGNLPIDSITDTCERVVFYDVFDHISIGDKQFYQKYVVSNYVDRVVMKIGKCFTITFPHSVSESLEQKPTISFTACSSLRARAKDLEFWIAFVEADGFALNNSFKPFQITSKPPIESMEKAKDQLRLLQEIITTLDILHITEDIDLTRLTDRDWRELSILVKAFVNRALIENIRRDLPHTYYLAIDNIHIALVHSEFDDDGKVEVFDFFDAPFIYSFFVDGIQHIAPTYAVLDKEAWAMLANIPFDDVLPSFKKAFSQNNDAQIFAMANNTLISILLAYDDTRKVNLLKTGLKIADWLLDDCPNEILAYPIRLINALQTIRRERELDKEERLKVLEITEDTNTEERFRVGAYLLLRNQEAAELHFYRMDDDTQNAFRNWPIYHFWQEMADMATSEKMGK